MDKKEITEFAAICFNYRDNFHLFMQNTEDFLQYAYEQGRKEVQIEYAKDMKTKVEPEKKVNFYQWLDFIDANLIITRYHTQNGRYAAKIEYSEIKDGCMLRGTYGEGKTSIEAVLNYIQKINGQRIVLNAPTSNRREFNVPIGLYLGE